MKKGMVINMRRKNNHKAFKGLNNSGFSLVELLISIIILVIIMVPLMSNFIRSMQMNKKAETYQVQSNLAASVMEGLKASTIEEVIEEFIGSQESFTIIPNEVGSITGLKLTSENEYEITNITDEQDIYYFAINGVVENDSIYDVLIKLDATIYDKEISVGGDTQGILNKYPMPEIINLDEKANGIIFSDGSTVQSITEAKENNVGIPFENIPKEDLDQNVLNLLGQQGRTFAEAALYQSQKYADYLSALDQYRNACEEAAMKEGVPTLAPPIDLIEPTIWDPDLDLKKYFTPEDIVMNVTKNMIITVSDNIIQYEIEYVCDFDDGVWNEISITNSVDRVEYASSLENVYLSYKQSIFHGAHTDKDLLAADIIRIRNTTSNPINFFVADQNNPTQNSIHIKRQEGEPITVFTDVETYKVFVGDVEDTNPDNRNDGLVKTYDLDRIFDITIDICKAETNQENRYKEKYYTLKSTKER